MPFESSTSEHREPFIVRGTEIKEDGFGLATAQEIGSEYEDSLDTLQQTFGWGPNLMPAYIRTIEAKTEGESGDHGGLWINRDRKLGLYKNGIKHLKGFLGSEAIWKPILYHELGHAFYDSAGGVKQDRVSNKVANEAFAWLIGLVIATKGDQQKITEALAPASDPHHTLFSLDLEKPYPDYNKQAKDSIKDLPLLYYLLSTKGILTVLDVTGKLSPHYETVKSLLPPDEAQRRGKETIIDSHQRQTELHKYLQETQGFGLGTLSLKSHEWYRRNAKNNLMKPPTMGERLRKAAFLVPGVDRGPSFIKRP